MGKILFIFFFIFLSNCSINNNSSFWKQKDIVKNNIEIVKENINENSDYETFKKKIIKYGKESTFPKLDE